MTDKLPTNPPLWREEDNAMSVSHFPPLPSENQSITDANAAERRADYLYGYQLYTLHTYLPREVDRLRKDVRRWKQTAAVLFVFGTLQWLLRFF